MTWNSITPQKFVELVNYWVNQDWPLTEDKLAAAMEKLGWDESDPSSIAKDIPVNRPMLMVTSDPVAVLNTISWSLTDVDIVSSSARDVFMNDTFVGYVNAGKAAWGDPKIVREQEDETAIWTSIAGCQLQLSNTRSSVGIFLHSPQFTQILNED